MLLTIIHLWRDFQERTFYRMLFSTSVIFLNRPDQSVNHARVSYKIQTISLIAHRLNVAFTFSLWAYHVEDCFISTWLHYLFIFLEATNSTFNTNYSKQLQNISLHYIIIDFHFLNCFYFSVSNISNKIFSIWSHFFDNNTLIVAFW